MKPLKRLFTKSLEGVSMSKRKTRYQKIIKTEKQLKKQNLMGKIKELENKITISNKQNKQAKFIKNLKFFRNGIALLSVFVLTSGISVGGIKVLGGGFPIIKDDIKKFKKYYLEYESNKTILAKSTYLTKFENSDSANTLEIYSPWKESFEHSTNQKFYTRFKRTYSLSLDIPKLYEAVLKQDLGYINKNFSNYQEEEVTTNQKPDDINNNYIIIADLSFLDEKDSLIVLESDLKNILISIINDILGFGIPLIVIFKKRNEIKYSFQNITGEYLKKVIPISPLEEELKGKRKQLTKLQGGSYDN